VNRAAARFILRSRCAGSKGSDRLLFRPAHLTLVLTLWRPLRPVLFGTKRASCFGFFWQFRLRISYTSRTLNPIKLRRQNKITFRQPINLMRPSRNLRLPPPQQNIRMMPLLLRDRPHLIHKRERLLKIRKRKRSHNVMPIHHLPPRHLFRQSLEFFSSQRRNPATAWHTSLLRQLAHNSLPPAIVATRNSTRTTLPSDIPPAPTQADQKSRDGFALAPSAILLRDKSYAAPPRPVEIPFPVRTKHAR